MLPSSKLNFAAWTGLGITALFGGTGIYLVGNSQNLGKSKDKEKPKEVLNSFGGEAEQKTPETSLKEGQEASAPNLSPETAEERQEEQVTSDLDNLEQGQKVLDSLSSQELDSEETDSDREKLPIPPQADPKPASEQTDSFKKEDEKDSASFFKEQELGSPTSNYSESEKENQDDNYDVSSGITNYTMSDDGEMEIVSSKK